MIVKPPLQPTTLTAGLVGFNPYMSFTCTTLGRPLVKMVNPGVHMGLKHPHIYQSPLLLVFNLGLFGNEISHSIYKDFFMYNFAS